MTEIAHSQLAAASAPPMESSVRGRLGAFAPSLGVFLLAAAFVKAFAAADAATLQSVYDVPRWLVIAAVQAELIVGALLVAGVWRRPAWQAAVALFGAFAAFSLYRGLTGYESCGCFGSLKINPWWTLAFDVAILTLLIRWRRELVSEPGRRASAKFRWLYLGSLVLLAALTHYQMVSGGPSRLNLDEPALGAGKLVILEPETWIGKTFPLSEQLAPKPDLSHGDWTLLLYHHDCPKCQEALPHYEQLALNRAASNEPARVLLVQTPPYAHEESHRPSPATHARLSDDREWFVQTPVEIRLSGGRVVSVSLDVAEPKFAGSGAGGL